MFIPLLVLHWPIDIFSHRHINTMHINFEFKASHQDISAAEQILLKYDPLFIGEDHR
jgi:hypothetical protein